MHEALHVACEACNKCQARTEQSINNFLKINKDLEEQLQAALEAQPEPAAPSEVITKLLDLLEPDIEAKERIINNDPRLAEIIALFRIVRPKQGGRR